MTPEEEAQIKETIWSRMRRRLGEDYLTEHEAFLEAQWEMAKAFGMIDPEMDLTS